MKLKKTLSIIMAAALSVATLTGCSETSKNYVGELSKVSSWKAQSSESTGNIKIEGQGLNQEITFESKGKSSGNKAYAEMKFNDPSGKMKVPDMKIYVIDNDTFINKGYFEGIYTMAGQEVPEKIKNINGDYIGVNSGVDVEQFKLMMNKPETIIDLAQSVFGDSDIDLPYVQNGREYTIELDSNAMVDLGVKGIKAVTNNLENINSTFNLGLQAQNISDIKALIGNESFGKGVESVKSMLAGSTFSSKEVFEDDKYTMNMDMNIKVENKFNVYLTVNSISTKAEKEEITLPNNCIKYSKDDFDRLFGANKQLGINKTSLE